MIRFVAFVIYFACVAKVFLKNKTKINTKKKKQNRGNICFKDKNVFSTAFQKFLYNLVPTRDLACLNIQKKKKIFRLLDFPFYFFLLLLLLSMVLWSYFCIEMITPSNSCTNKLTKNFLLKLSIQTIEKGKEIKKTKRKKREKK